MMHRALQQEQPQHRHGRGVCVWRCDAALAAGSAGRIVQVPHSLLHVEISSSVRKRLIHAPSLLQAFGAAAWSESVE